MTTQTIYEEEASFSRMVQDALDGGSVVIARAGRPVAKIVPVVEEPERKPRVFGQKVMGDIYFAPDWEEDLPLDMWDCLRDDVKA